MDSNSINVKMTAEQVAQKFGYSVTSVKTKFKRTQQSIKKKYNVEVIKCQGIGGTFYIVSDPRAKTMFDEVKNELYIPFESLKIEDFAFYILIGIAATPQGVFRGTRKDLLKYIGVAVNEKNEKMVDACLILWMKLNVIIFDIDENVITAHMRVAFERTEVIPIQMLKECQRIVKENHKQNIKIIQLVKIWQAHRICQKNQPFTISDIQKYINLSKDQIVEGRKLLHNSNMFRLHAAMIPGTVFRQGSTADINGNYDNNNIEIINGVEIY